MSTRRRAALVALPFILLGAVGAVYYQDTPPGIHYVTDPAYGTCVATPPGVMPTVDCGPAAQAACVAAIAGRGGQVIFPAGNYLIRSLIRCIGSAADQVNLTVTGEDGAELWIDGNPEGIFYGGAMGVWTIERLRFRPLSTAGDGVPDLRAPIICAPSGAALVVRDNAFMGILCPKGRGCIETGWTTTGVQQVTVSGNRFGDTFARYDSAAQSHGALIKVSKGNTVFIENNAFVSYGNLGPGYWGSLGGQGQSEAAILLDKGYFSTRLVSRRNWFDDCVTFAVLVNPDGRATWTETVGSVTSEDDYSWQGAGQARVKAVNVASVVVRRFVMTGTYSAPFVELSGVQAAQLTGLVIEHDAQVQSVTRMTIAADATCGLVELDEPAFRFGAGLNLDLLNAQVSRVRMGGVWSRPAVAALAVSSGALVKAQPLGQVAPLEVADLPADAIGVAGMTAAQGARTLVSEPGQVVRVFADGPIIGGDPLAPSATQPGLVTPTAGGPWRARGDALSGALVPLAL
jgi:hypothetical protein